MDSVDFDSANVGAGGLQDDLVVNHVGPDGRLIEPKFAEIGTIF